MRISLTEETGNRIREVLGNDVDLAPDVVPSVLARLAVEAPAVYSQVLEELSGSQIRLDSESEMLRRRRRSLLRRLLFWWGEYETDAGDRMLEKRHIAAGLPLALALLTMVLLAITLVAGRRVVPSAVSHPVAARSPLREDLRQATRSPALAPQLIPVAPNEPLGTTRSSPARPQGQTPIASMLPVPALPPGLSGFPDASGRGLGSPIVVNLQASANRESARLGDPPRAISPLVYNRSSELEAQRREGSAAAADPAASGRGLARGETPALPGSLVPGSRISGTLLTGALVVPGGPPVPVVAETADPHGIWTGQAMGGPGDRVQMTLTLAAHRRTETVRAIVLDPAGSFPGLQGHSTLRHPSAAAALTAAALHAASDYAQAVSRQGSLGVNGVWGPLVLGGQVPEPWTYLAARLAQDFQARGNQAGWVTTIEIPAGTPLVILIMGAS